MNEVIKLICPRCRHQFDFTLHTGIYLNEEPELRDKIKDLSLFRFVCPDCGFSIPVEYPCSVVDKAHDVLLFSVPVADRTKEEYAEFIAGASRNVDYSNGCIYRFVNCKEALAEKLSIFDNNYDDRAIELYKLKYYFVWRNEYPKMTSAYFLDDSKGFNLNIFADQDIIATIPLDPKEYQDIVTKYFFDSKVRGQKLKIVNQEWAEEYLEKFEKVS